MSRIRSNLNVRIWDRWNTNKTTRPQKIWSINRRHVLVHTYIFQMSFFPSCVSYWHCVYELIWIEPTEMYSLFIADEEKALINFNLCSWLIPRNLILLTVQYTCTSIGPQNYFSGVAIDIAYSKNYSSRSFNVLNRCLSKRFKRFGRYHLKWCKHIVWSVNEMMKEIKV